jgi:hypothetical protein
VAVGAGLILLHSALVGKSEVAQNVAPLLVAQVSLEAWVFRSQLQQPQEPSCNLVNQTLVILTIGVLSCNPPNWVGL